MKVKTYDEKWKLEAAPFIEKAFEAFKPRSEFIAKSTGNRNIKNSDEEQSNILEVRTSLSPYTDKLADFDEVFSECPNYSEIRKTLDFIISEVSKEIISAKVNFITFSTDLTSASSGVRHLHPKMNGDRCNVMTFGIPLFLGNTPPSFDIHISKDQWPARYYVDYSRVRDLDLSYVKLVMPMDGSIFHMQFDGSRHPHVITYTDSVFMWFVFDGVEFKDNRDLGPSLSISYL